jgi:hypothetical protein
MTFVPLLLRAALAALALASFRVPGARAQYEIPHNPVADQLNVQGRLVGRDLYDRLGDKIGTIEQVLKAPNGMITGVGVDIGTYLGLGPRRIAVPAWQLDSVDNKLTTRDLTRDSVQNMPSEY